MVKNGLVIPPKYGVYTDTKEADKKTSWKGMYNFEKYVNYIAGWNYHLGGKNHHAICSVQLHLFGTQGVVTQYQTRW